jgi:hypothetical protein
MSHRLIFLICFAALQIAGFLTVLVIIAMDVNGPNPWPIVISMGAVLGQCSLSAAFAVFGPWRLTVRIIASAILVVTGGMSLIYADSPRTRWGDFFLIGLFAVLMWLMNQLPLWLCRLLLHARAVTTNNDVSDQSARSQYRIRQLMALTLAVSLILGIGRVILPQQSLQELKDMKTLDWIAFSSTGIAVGLIVATTIITTLNPLYLRSGLVVSAVSSAFIAYGIYSIFGILSFGPAGERIFFSVLVLSTYIWLQISILFIRAAGYRIVVEVKQGYPS